jgi:hypothetical protein
VNHFPPSPLKITLGVFQIFSKICRDIHKSRCTTGINDTSGKFGTGINVPAANFAMGLAGVVDTGGKFATCVNNSRGCQRHLWQIKETISD